MAYYKDEGQLTIYYNVSDNEEFITLIEEWKNHRTKEVDYYVLQHLSPTNGRFDILAKEGILKLQQITKKEWNSVVSSLKDFVNGGDQ